MFTVDEEGKKICPLCGSDTFVSVDPDLQKVLAKAMVAYVNYFIKMEGGDVKVSRLRVQMINEANRDGLLRD